MQYIKIIAVICLFAVCGISSYSQMVPMDSNGIDSFTKRLEESSRQIESIESNFEQVKHLDIFNDDVVSKGLFYYSATDKIALIYSAPVKYSMVINGDILKSTSNGKVNTIALGSNKMMKELQSMITACMTGNITTLGEDYQASYSEDSSSYRVVLTPLNAAIRAYIAGFSIYFDKKDMSVERLRIDEGTADYTEYRFLDRKFNTVIDSKLFSVN